MKKSIKGFTIVELLIVIVVIAILAAISVVAYRGVQQRASNTAIISTVNQAAKSISGYIAVNGAYPVTSNSIGCVVPAASSCTSGGTVRTANTTFNNNLATIAILPSSALPDARPEYNGIVFDYGSTRTFNGTTQPLVLGYSLRGSEQQCGMPNVVSGSPFVSSTTGWTLGNANHTTCIISIPGP